MNFASITSWTTSASFLISSGERMPLIMSIFTRGIVGGDLVPDEGFQAQMVKNSTMIEGRNYGRRIFSTSTNDAIPTSAMTCLILEWID